MGEGKKSREVHLDTKTHHQTYHFGTMDGYCKGSDVIELVCMDEHFSNLHATLAFYIIH